MPAGYTDRAAQTEEAKGEAMTEIVWPCGGHKYDDVGVVCGACHDAEVSRLKAQLASMTKRAEEAEKTCDDYMIDIEALGRKVDAAEVKLAMAEAAAQRDAELIDIGGRLATIVFNTSQPAYDLADYDRKVMREWSDKWDAKSRERRLALRDLGVEPGEVGK